MNIDFNVDHKWVLLFHDDCMYIHRPISYLSAFAICRLIFDDNRFASGGGIGQGCDSFVRRDDESALEKEMYFQNYEYRS